MGSDRSGCHQFLLRPVRQALQTSIHFETSMTSKLFPNETSIWETPLRIKRESLQNLCADCFSAGAPLDFRGVPENLPQNASGRMSPPRVSHC